MAVRDEFESITESSRLVEKLRERVRSDGAITFREFMAAALYDERDGYYSRPADQTTRSGDFVTSPEVHPIFGALVAKQLHELWSLMSRPARFDIVEQGAGSGRLARDILEWSRRDEGFAAAIRYQIVEIAPLQREAQQRALGDLAASVAWSEALPAGVTGCIVSNELLDAFPVHRVVRQGDTLREVLVDLDLEGDGFVDKLAPMSDPAIQRYFDDLGVLPGEGCYAEVNLDAACWAADVARAVERGYVLTFDYGYEAPDLYAPWRRDGTLLCFYRQSASSDPYQRIGKQDMTSSVDFTTVRRAGEAAGLRTLAFTDQASFLTRMGISDGIASIVERRPAEMEEYFARRRVVMDLIDPARLGRIKVLLQGKDVPDAVPRGFRDE